MKHGTKSNNGKFITLSGFRSLFGEGEIDYSGIITGMLKTVYKLEQKQIDSILKYGKIVKDGETSTDVATPETILSTLTGLDQARVTKLKTDSQDGKFQEGYAKAKKEVLTEFETGLKEEYGVTSDLTGKELADHIIAEKLKEAGATTEDAIKKSPTYQALENRLKKELQDAKKEGEDKVKQLETTYKKEQAFAKVGTSAIDILTGLNPVLPKNATVAETQKRDFLNELKGFEYEVHEDGTIVVMQGGKVLEDGHGNTLDYQDHIKKIAANRFEFAENNGGANGGNKNNQGQNGKYPANVAKPKNVDELAKLIGEGSALTGEEKLLVADEYRKRNAPAQ